MLSSFLHKSVFITYCSGISLSLVGMMDTTELRVSEELASRYYRYTMLTRFKEGTLTLDAVFEKTLPKDIVKKIVHEAYGKIFFVHFIAAQSLELFTSEHLPNCCSPRITKDQSLKKYIKSGMRDPKKFAYFDNPTAVHYATKSKRVLMGYEDGNVMSYHDDELPPHDYKIKYPNLMQLNPAPVTTLIRPRHCNEDGKLDPIAITGHKDGSILLFSASGPSLKLLKLEDVVGQIVSMAATQQVLIAADAQRIFLIPDYWSDRYIGNNSVKSVKTHSNYNITDIGYRGCMIVAQLEHGYFYTITPYSNEGFERITNGDFSPTQAGIIYHLIKRCFLSQEEKLTKRFISPLMLSVINTGLASNE